MRIFVENGADDGHGGDDEDNRKSRGFRITQILFRPVEMSNTLILQGIQ